VLLRSRPGVSQLMQVACEPDVHPLFLDDEMVDTGGVDGEFALPRRTRPQLLHSRARPIESSRMWFCNGLIGQSGTKTCRPNLTSMRRTRGACRKLRVVRDNRRP
jgi:hypothetical protein